MPDGFEELQQTFFGGKTEDKEAVQEPESEKTLFEIYSECLKAIRVINHREQ